jgi:hypothetical protein
MAETIEVVHALYAGFFERGVRYFFPDAKLIAEPRGGSHPAPVLRFLSRTDGAVDLEWMAARYHFSIDGRPLTEHEMRLLAAIGAVLSARYRSIFSVVSAAAATRVFAGLPEDRYVSAFLDYLPYLEDGALAGEHTWWRTPSRC